MSVNDIVKKLTGGTRNQHAKLAEPTVSTVSAPKQKLDFFGITNNNDTKRGVKRQLPKDDSDANPKKKQKTNDSQPQSTQQKKKNNKNKRRRMKQKQMQQQQTQQENEKTDLDKKVNDMLGETSEKDTEMIENEESDSKEQDHESENSEDENEEGVKQNEGAEDGGDDEELNQATQALVAANPQLLKKYRIKVDGTNVTEPIATWDELEAKLHSRKYLLKNVLKAKYDTPTPVQMQVIPTLASKREVLVAAPTGSGKTASYAIPILIALGKPQKVNSVQAVIVVPTNELATQVMTEFQKLSEGKPFKLVQLAKVSKQVMNNFSDDQATKSLGNSHVIITTPKRLMHVLEKGSLNLKSTEYLILDESDRLFSGDFLSQMDTIIDACQNPKLRISMFSATMLPKIEEMSKTVMKDPVKILVGPKNTVVSTVTQKLVYCGSEEGKVIALRSLIRSGITPPVLIFVQSKERAQQLFRELVLENINVGVISSEKTVAQRELTTEQFRNGRIWFLIATNLFSRGMDFTGINLVLNFDLPQSAADYIHRVGRTGRMGRTGTAITYYTDDDISHLKQIVNVVHQSGQPVPEFLKNLKLEEKESRNQLQVKPVSRDAVGTSAQNSKVHEKNQRKDYFRQQAIQKKKSTNNNNKKNNNKQNKKNNNNNNN